MEPDPLRPGKQFERLFEWFLTFQQLNPRPEAVRIEEFGSSEFVDACDVVQVECERYGGCGWTAPR